ncbi:MAG: hypothetical protein Q4A92_11400 [Corynebacterium sp.]|nr:hypothetical protein [Corynebacterium sp.]
MNIPNGTEPKGNTYQLGSIPPTAQGAAAGDLPPYAEASETAVLGYPIRGEQTRALTRNEQPQRSPQPPIYSNPVVGQQGQVTQPSAMPPTWYQPPNPAVQPVHVAPPPAASYTAPPFQPTYVVMQPPLVKNGAAAWSLSLGIISSLLFLSVLFTAISWIFAFFGVLTGIAGIAKSRKISGPGARFGVAFAGLFLSSLVLIVCVVIVAYFAPYIAEVWNTWQQCSADPYQTDIPVCVLEKTLL